MSQAVANAKQFGASTKSTGNIKKLVGNTAAKNFVTPKIADKNGNDEKNPYVSPATLRAQKKQYKKILKMLELASLTKLQVLEDRDLKEILFTEKWLRTHLLEIIVFLAQNQKLLMQRL